MENSSVISIKVKKISIHQQIENDDQLAIEEPLEIQIEYSSQSGRMKKNISVTMRTPGNDEELSIGFLFTEGIIKKKEQVAGISHAAFDENIVSVILNENEKPAIQNVGRNFYMTSSCGVCGKSSIDAIRTESVFQNKPDTISIKAGLFYGLENLLTKRQAVFEATGGLHSSGLFDVHGNFIMLREDVGRHNALDKLIGAAFLNDLLPLNAHILLLSGRASFELIQKAAMAGIKIVAAIGAPSSLAVQLAEENNMTLVGFLRNERFNIYTGSQRIDV